MAQPREGRRHKVILVRHAAPEPVGEDAARWGLSEEGRAAAAALAARLAPSPGTAIVTSPEPKARQTAAALAAVAGLPPSADERLREVGRTWIPEGYEDVAGFWLAGGAVDGWEDRAVVAARMQAAVGELPTDAYVVTHGLALTTLVAPPDPVAYWRALAMPDAREWAP